MDRIRFSESSLAEDATCHRPHGDLVICPIGDYQNRQPLAYESINKCTEGRIRITADIGEADIVIVSHTKDIKSKRDELYSAIDKSKILVLLSEEPFWDTVWSDDLFTRVQIAPESDGKKYFYLNHYTSKIFDFDAIPYFLLTNHSFAIRYARWFARNAVITKAEWLARLKAVETRVAFLAEARRNQKFEVKYPKQDVFGLAAYRTKVADACRFNGVQRLGAGWQKGRRRQSLRDWHLDKFFMLDGKCQLISAIENTHQRNYISEKFFDAFAMGGVPVYFASKKHRVHEFAEEGSWLNIAGLTPSEAAKRIEHFTIDDAFLRAYVETQKHLADLFNSPLNWVRERDRLVGALVDEFSLIISDHGYTKI